MGRQLSRTVVRGAVLVAVVAFTAVALGAAVLDDVRVVGTHLAAHGLGALSWLPLDDVLVAVCSLALLGCATWLLAVTCLVVGETLADCVTRRGDTTSSRFSPKVCPPALRRLLLVGCGAALVGGLGTSVALADTTGAGQPGTAAISSTPPAARLSGLAVPDRVAAHGPGPAADRLPPGTLRVAAGDSLWALAREALGGRPSDARTATAWQAIYRANLDQVGPDPDLIRPGTVLDMPDLDPSQRKEPS